MPEIEQLATVVVDVLVVVETFDQNVDWSAEWDTPEEMVRDLHDHLARLRRGDISRVPELRYLFLPTGPLQEVSISSGWADYYLLVSARFDAAVRESQP